MRKRTPSLTTVPPTLVRGVVGAFEVSLLVALVLAPTVFGGLHRFGDFDLLLVVCLLLVFWVVCTLMGVSLSHPRAHLNLLLWGLLALLLAQTLPLPGVEPPGAAERGLGPAAALLTDLAHGGSTPRPSLPVGRWSLRPTATAGVIVLATSAAGLYWVVGAATVGRRRIRRTTWAVLLGLGLVAVWVIIAAVRGPAPTEAERPAGGVARLGGPLMVLGGDSWVPALLAALPLCLAAALRSLGGMPRRPPNRRQSRWGWIDRASTVWGMIGLALAGLVAVALGTCNVPAPVLGACVFVAAGFVLTGYVAASRRQREGRRPLGMAVAVGLWVLAAVWAGSALGPPRAPASSANGRIAELLAAMTPARALFGAGGGSVSPRATFGEVGWPAAPGDDADTDGFLLLRAELGWAGAALVLGAAVALVALLVGRRGDRARGPWPRIAMMAGLGGLLANFLYFRTDAVALTAPNLLALAGVVGLLVAWAVHGAPWRAARSGEVGPSHWPLVAGALGLTGALGLAENDMLVPASVDVNLSDKVLHFGTFSVLSLLLCYALGPQPTSRYLKTRILLAVAATTGLGVLMEYGQRYLTEGRAFEVQDMIANGVGAVLMGLLWWVVRRGQSWASPAGVAAAPGPGGRSKNL